LFFITRSFFTLKNDSTQRRIVICNHYIAIAVHTIHTVLHYTALHYTAVYVTYIEQHTYKQTNIPEGPEVWILGMAIQRVLQTTSMPTSTPTPPQTISHPFVYTHGKHLFVIQPVNNGSDSFVYENLSFGMVGKVYMDPCTYRIVKQESGGWITGTTESFSSAEALEASRASLGIDWMLATEEQLFQQLQSWMTSRKQLASLIVDQSRIAGIGVAWGSEILHRARLLPHVASCKQQESMHLLLPAILSIRQELILH
jgi:hypothetical protein